MTSRLLSFLADVSTLIADPWLLDLKDALDLQGLIRTLVPVKSAPAAYNLTQVYQIYRKERIASIALPPAFRLTVLGPDSKPRNMSQTTLGSVQNTNPFREVSPTRQYLHMTTL